LRVVERRDQLLERARESLGEVEALVRFERARTRIDAVDDRALGQAVEGLALLTICSAVMLARKASVSASW
jgi:hypothetical protein